MRSLGFPLLGVTALLVACLAAQVGAAPADNQLSWADVALAKPPSTVVPPAPDPDVIAQGGDTCATATVISSLPFTASGTTVGYTNDYDETCPYSGSTSPDVVYAYTPAADTSVDVTLCTGTTNYDTKMYLYAGTCPAPGSGAYVACNDDACDNSPVFPNSWISEVTNVAMTAGQTYYIVVDGYGGGSGDYTIEVNEWQPPPPPVECQGDDLLYYQTVIGSDGSWNAFTSGQTTSFDYAMFDNFTSNLFSIEDVRWWGLSLLWDGAGWSACDPAGLTFNVTFHDDNGGQPGAALCTYAGISPAGVNTGALYSGYPLYFWEALGLAPACEPTGASWVSVKSFANPAGCVLLWMNATGGDLLSYQHDGSTYTAQPHDMALCLNGAIIPVELQSFSAE